MIAELLRRCSQLLIGALVLTAIAGCQTTTDTPISSGNFSPLLAQPAPAAASLKPGLAVDYSNVIANRISDVEVAGRGTPGRPLPNLNWPQADGTPVMTSEYSIHVAARIDGYIKFAEAGAYELRILSNDGVRLMIGGSTVLADPTVHTSRLAGPVTLTIKEAGWYNLSLLYFQKAGSAALELHWRRPGQSDFEAVPDAAFAHAGS